MARLKTVVVEFRPWPQEPRLVLDGAEVPGVFDIQYVKVEDRGVSVGVWTMKIAGDAVITKTEA